MSSPDAALTEVRGMYERLDRIVEALGCAIYSADVLTARYAAASLTELGDRIETALLAADREAHALVAGAIRNVGR